MKKDIISKLPDDIIEYILVKLPSKDAMRTSLLSRHWRNTWAILAGSLVLDARELIAFAKNNI